jgi:Tol biopolymer transport system component
VPEAAVSQGRSAARENTDALVQLAHETGGFFFENSNDLIKGMRQGSSWRRRSKKDNTRRASWAAERRRCRSCGTVAFAAKPEGFYYREMWLMMQDGKQAQKLYEADANSDFGSAEWSPDWKRLAYSRPRVAADKFENSIESRDLKGGPATTIIPSATGVADWCWSPDGRIIFSLYDPDPNGNSCNFWATRVDARTGEPRDQPRRLTNWAGFCMDSTSATADGKRLTFRKWSWQGSLYVADFQANGVQITSPSRHSLATGHTIRRHGRSIARQFF